MQSLFNHTVHRIFEIETVKSMQIKENIYHFEKLYKWQIVAVARQSKNKTLITMIHHT
jgi:hypothetical protein